MNEATARRIAEIFSGEAYQSGGGFWTVRIRKEDGRIVLFSDHMIAEFASEKVFDSGANPINKINLYN